MICLIGLGTVDAGVEVFYFGWMDKSTPFGAQMVTVGLQMMLLGMLVMA